VSAADASTRFDRDTAVTRVAENVWESRIDRGWWVMAGPNGGYLAAILVRALEAAVADPARAARSLSVHYTRPPVEGPARIETRVERAGRSLTSVSARLVQREGLVALALGAFSKPRSSAQVLSDAHMPEVAPPERCPAMEERIPIHERYEQRWAVGAQPFSAGEHALCGGWIRLREPRRVDAALAAAFCDAFPPALFSSVREGAVFGGVPTVDLTVHFRASLPLAGAAADAFTLAVFRSRLAREGFLEEDGELWSSDGALLAQSRQLALAR
jgi:acyl-CoA thioesterase